MLRRKRHAVDLVCEERVSFEQRADGKAPLVCLLLPALDAAVEPGEQHVDRALPDACLLQERRDRRAAPARRAHRLEEPGLADDARLDVHPAVPRALHRHRDLDGGSRTEVVERERERPLDEPADLEPPARGVDVGDVVVREEVVEPDRREVPAKRLERQRVVARRELELLQADPLGQGLAHDPSTLTARAATRRIDDRRDERLDAPSEPSRAASSAWCPWG